MGDHLPRFADPGFQWATWNFENKQFRTLEKLSGVGQPWIEQHEITGFQYGLAAVLLQSEPSRDLLIPDSGIPSFLGMGEVDPDVWHLKYRSTEAAM